MNVMAAFESVTLPAFKIKTPAATSMSMNFPDALMKAIRSKSCLVKVQTAKGTSPNRTTAYSLESKARRNMMDPQNKVVKFLFSKNLKVYKKVSEINMSEKISSRLFTLAIASVCIGCAKKSNADKKAMSWLSRNM